jgi:beta-glucosidase
MQSDSIPRSGCSYFFFIFTEITIASMKRFFKILGSIILSVVLIILLFFAYIFISAKITSHSNLSKLGPEASTLVQDGFSFRDLNKNGKLDVYEDSRQPLEARADNLLSQMTLEEKCGTMYATMIIVSSDGKLSESPEMSNAFSFMAPGNSSLIVDKKINSFGIFNTPSTKAFAEWQNSVQKLAEQTRLGIPVTLMSNPRNHFTENMLASMSSGDFSLWPETMGFAAIGDTGLVHEFADIARQEYISVGLRVAMHPMADLATEPRWPRINESFGEDPTLVSKMVTAYIKGFQGDSLNSQSVACVTKHFPGGGPQKEGLEPHFQFQKGQVYPGHNFATHLLPFKAAIAAGTAQIMPGYGVPIGVTKETLGPIFNKELTTVLLRDSLHFKGVVTSDWGAISGMKVFGMNLLEPPAHGLMNLTPEERLVKAIDAGVDQIGGDNSPERLVALVKAGKISEQRINESTRRILLDKFRLGLFDNPYVDVQKAIETVGKKEFRDKGEDAQRRSLVLLKNATIKEKKALPLGAGLKIYVQGFDKKTAGEYATVVDSPASADFAIIRINTPYIPRKGLVESLMHDGDLDFKEPEKSKILSLLKKTPTIVNIYLQRPAIIPEIAENSAGLIANFGASDRAILDVIFGKASPHGKLPIELPSSMEAVRNQKEDLPYDSKNPLFPFGFGLSY